MADFWLVDKERAQTQVVGVGEKSVSVSEEQMRENKKWHKSTRKMHISNNGDEANMAED